MKSYLQYVAAEKKILNLCSIENDSTKSYLANYPLIRNYDCFRVYSQEESLALIDWFEPPILLSGKQQEDRQMLLLSHSKEKIADAYMKELI